MWSNLADADRIVRFMDGTDIIGLAGGLLVTSHGTGTKRDCSYRHLQNFHF